MKKAADFSPVELQLGMHSFVGCAVIGYYCVMRSTLWNHLEINVGLFYIIWFVWRKKSERIENGWIWLEFIVYWLQSHITNCQMTRIS